MLGKKQEVQYAKFSTLIGAEDKFEGRFHSKGTVRVEGELKGEIFVDGNLFIGETGKIIGSIHGVNIFVAGEVEGNIEASGQLRISSIGKVYGDVHVASFILDENSVYEGNCKMKKGDSKIEKKLAEEK